MSTDQTIDQLEKYYDLNIRHLQWSFWSSLGALITGLIALLIGVYMIITGDIGLATQLSIVGGVLTQFIGAGFFFLYNKNLKQLNVFYDKLIKHKDTLYAISLSNQLDDANKTSSQIAIIGSLLSRGEPATPPEVLKAIIEKKG